MEKRKKRNNFGVLLIVIIIISLILITVKLVKKNNTEKNLISNTQIADSQTNTHVQEIENGIKLNTSSKINEAKEVDGYKFTNIQLTTKNGITTLLMDVTNISGAKKELKNAKITLLDENGNELTTLKGIIAELEKNSSTQINTATTSDYVNAYDLKISIE